MHLFKHNDNHDLNRKRPFLKLIGKDVHVDWILSVIVSVLIAIALVVLGFYAKNNFHNTLQNEKTNTPSKDASSIDTKTLDRVLNRFSEKKVKREEYLNNFTAPADPSL
jgi:uncharacterized membrane protein